MRLWGSLNDEVVPDAIGGAELAEGAVGEADLESIAVPLLHDAGAEGLMGDPGAGRDGKGRRGVPGVAEKVMEEAGVPQMGGVFGRGE